MLEQKASCTNAATIRIYYMTIYFRSLENAPLK
jgi:hypothetical protein